MRAVARVVVFMLAAALMALPSAASAQSPSCAVYPQLCPPPTTTTTTTTTPTTTTTATQQPGGATAAGGPPGQQVQDTRTSGGGPGTDEEDGGNGAEPQSAANPATAGGRGPIGVRTGRERGRCWYAIVHVGKERDDIEDEVERALGLPCFVLTLREPVDTEGLARVLRGTPHAGVSSDESDRDLLRRLGRAVGDEVPTPSALLRLVRPVMFSDYEGRLQPVSGIVVTHDLTDLEGDEASIRTVLGNALTHGIRDSKVPATNGQEMKVPTVGTEFTTTKPSWVPWFKARKISSVDNLDQRTGRQALSMLMSGAQPGHYGVKDSADALLPKAGGAQPVRFRTASAITAPTESGIGLGLSTVLFASLLMLVAGWSIGVAGRRRLRRLRHTAR